MVVFNINMRHFVLAMVMKIVYVFLKAQGKVYCF